MNCEAQIKAEKSSSLSYKEGKEEKSEETCQLTTDFIATETAIAAAATMTENNHNTTPTADTCDGKGSEINYIDTKKRTKQLL